MNRDAVVWNRWCWGAIAAMTVALAGLFIGYGVGAGFLGLMACGALVVLEAATRLWIRAQDHAR